MTLDHYARAERSAAKDLARELRRVASRLDTEARAIDDGRRVPTHTIRSDISEIEALLRECDKAQAAADAVRAALAEKSEWP